MDFILTKLNSIKVDIENFIYHKNKCNYNKCNNINVFL